MPPAPQQQSAPASNGGWRRLGDSSPNYSNSPGDPQNQFQNQQGPAPVVNIPPQLTIKPGTYVTVRVNQPLSSDKNQAGDAFSGSLVRPIVVDGIVVAERGQLVGGRVSEAQKAGRVQGVSKLGLQLIDIPVVDGQQMPVQTTFVTRTGPTSVGRDAAAMGVTTAAGAAIGAGVGGAGGAAVGAGAGLLVSTVGVLFTRGHPTIIYPESVLTFRIEQPVTISTEHAQQAFRYVEPGDYQAAPPRMQTGGPGYGPPPGAAPYAAPYYGPGPYYAGYPYGYPYPYFYGGFYGPGIGFGFRGRRW
jgi:hypothetical protein